MPVLGNSGGCNGYQKNHSRPVIHVEDVSNWKYLLTEPPFDLASKHSTFFIQYRKPSTDVAVLSPNVLEVCRCNLQLPTLRLGVDIHAVVGISSGAGFNPRSTRQVRRSSAARFRVVIMTENVMQN
jgi:hypothetical protein